MTHHLYIFSTRVFIVNKWHKELRFCQPSITSNRALLKPQYHDTGGSYLDATFCGGWLALYKEIGGHIWGEQKLGTTGKSVQCLKLGVIEAVAA